MCHDHVLAVAFGDIHELCKFSNRCLFGAALIHTEHLSPELESIELLSGPGALDHVDAGGDGAGYQYPQGSRHPFGFGGDAVNLLDGSGSVLCKVLMIIPEEL